MQEQRRPKLNCNSPHAAPVLERVRATLKRSIKVAVDLVLPFAALVNQGQLEQRPYISAFAGEGDEHGDVGRVVLGVLPIGIEVDRPLVPADGEIFAGYVFPHSHALGKRVASDCELVRAIHGLGERLRRRRRDQGADIAVRRLIHGGKWFSILGSKNTDRLEHKPLAGHRRDRFDL